MATDDSNSDEFQDLVKKYFQTHHLDEHEQEKIQSFQQKNPSEADKIIKLEQEKFQKKVIQQQRDQVDLLKAQNYTEQGAISKLRASQADKQLTENGGKKLLHLTDTEVEAPDLEQRLRKLLNDEGILEHVLKEGSLPSNTVLIHTGDIGPDLFNEQKYRSQIFLPEILVEEGEIEGQSRDEFITLYRDLMDEAGIRDELLIQGVKNDEENQILQRFKYILFGIMDPQSMSSEELVKFRQKRDRLHSHLEKAISNHSRRNLKEIKAVFDKYGLNSDNFIIISGNHDVPSQVEEIFGDSYLRESETKEIAGIKFNRPIAGSTGSVYGPILGRDLMGSTEIKEQIPQIRYDSKPFQELKSYVHEMGFTHLNDQQIDSLISNSLRKELFGLKSGKLREVDLAIQEEVKDKITQRLESIASNLDTNAHVYLGHGDITHPQYAGIEESYLRKILEGDKTKSKVYFGGHIHSGGIKNVNGLYVINPGASKSFSHGASYFDKNNNFLATNSHSITPEQEFNMYHRPKHEIAGESFEDRS